MSMKLEQIMEAVHDHGMLPIAKNLDSTLKYVPDTKVNLWLCNYYENNRPALVLENSDTGEPVAKVTVNLPDWVQLPTDVLAIKDYSENQGVLTLLITNGIVRAVGTHAISKYGSVTLCKLTPAILEKLESTVTSIGE